MIAPDYSTMTRYVADWTPIDLLAQAYLVLADPDMPKTNHDALLNPTGLYLDDDWTKMAGRVLRGFAEGNPRPEHYPWGHNRLDQFWAPRAGAA